MRKIFCFALVLFLFGIGSISAQDSILVVDATQQLGIINRHVYGANYGPPTFVPPDLVEQAEHSGITFFRIPAGQYGNTNDFNDFLLDILYQQAESWGGELSISARLPGSGGTPEKAADLVQYTVDKGYNVRYWSIGVEPDLIDAYQGDSLTDLSQDKIDAYNRDWRLIAEAMLAVKPDILFIGPDVSQFPPTREGDPYNNVRREWVREFLKANGDLVNTVSIHRYPFPKGNQSSTTIDDLRKNTAEWDILVSNLRDVIQDVMGHDMPIGITEANSHWSNGGHGEATPDSFYNAIWWSDVLGRLIQQKVDIVAYFEFQSSGQNGEFGLLKQYEVRPTYYVYQLYKQFGSDLIASESSDADVSIYASKRDDGKLTLMVVNLGPDEKTKTLQIEGFTPSDDAEVWRLDAEHNAEQIASVDVSAGITVPGQSVTLYVVSGS